jgi:hypothetical protein
MNFVDKKWEHTVQLVSIETKNIIWIARFKHSYYSTLIKSKQQRLFFFFKNWVHLFLFIIGLLKNLFRGNIITNTNNYNIILLDNNRSYCNVLGPIASRWLNEGKKFKIFVPNKSLNVTKKLLERYNIPIEFFITENSLNVNFSLSQFLKTPYYVLKDLYFYFKGSFRKKLLNLPNYIQYSIHNHVYSKSVSIFLINKPLIVTAGDHWMWEGLFFMQAINIENLKSLIVQHGLLGEFYVPFFAKTFGVWGMHDYNYLNQKLSVEETKLEIIGSPYYFKFLIDFVDTFGKVEFENNEILTFYSQPYFKYQILGDRIYDEIVSYLNDLLPFAKSIHKKIKIHLHPLDNKEFYHFLNSDIEFTNTPLNESLANCNIAITVDSAVIFEAAVLGIPTIQCKRENIKRFVNYGNNRLTFIADSSKLLIEEVRFLTESKMNYVNFQNNIKEGLPNYLSPIIYF